MIKASVKLQELRRKIYSKVKTDSAGSGGVRKISTKSGGYTMTTIYDISTRKRLQTDRCIGFVAKRTGKPYEGKPHVRFEVAGDGEVLWRA
jgi:hypothetical protein